MACFQLTALFEYGLHSLKLIENANRARGG